MSSELEKFLNLINTPIEVKNENYIYFDADTGDIFKITNVPETAANGLSEVKVPYETVVDILDGKTRVDSHTMIFDPLEKKYRIKSKKTIEDTFTEDDLFYEIPKTLEQLDLPEIEPVYIGMEVDLWYEELEHTKGQHIWYNGDVYIIKDNIPANTIFSLNIADMIIQDVYLFDDENKSYNIASHIPPIETQDEYVGLHVDVWYNELEHFVGQHVWYQNSVYKILNDQPKDTEFDPENAECIIDTIKMYNDENQYLNFEKTDLELGDLILDCNQVKLIKNIVSKDSQNIQKIIKGQDVLDDVWVNIWYDDDFKESGDYYYYNKSIYKMNTNIRRGKFSSKNVDLVLDDVKLYDDSDKSLPLEKEVAVGDIILDNNKVKLVEEVAEVHLERKKSRRKKYIDKEPIYVGIHVDPWYKELNHYAGQHVWYKNSVYRIINDQEEKTSFDEKNVELIKNDVKLYNDKNKFLEFDKNIKAGDHIIDNNNMYLIKDIHESSFEKDLAPGMYILNNRKLELVRNKIEQYKIRDKNDKIINLEKKYSAPDVQIRQDIEDQCWKIKLSDKLIHSLTKNSIFLNTELHFSITELHDPTVLYRTLYTDFKTIFEEGEVEFPFKYQFEWDKQDVSVFTMKKFDSYYYEVTE